MAIGTLDQDYFHKLLFPKRNAATKGLYRCATPDPNTTGHKGLADPTRLFQFKAMCEQINFDIIGLGETRKWGEILEEQDNGTEGEDSKPRYRMKMSIYKNPSYILQKSKRLLRRAAK
ncbi:hypothetical protein ACFE04_019450 [Oxalis oulophora]